MTLLTTRKRDIRAWIRHLSRGQWLVDTVVLRRTPNGKWADQHQLALVQRDDTPHVGYGSVVVIRP